jgi:hypothetical protein
LAIFTLFRSRAPARFRSSDRDLTTDATRIDEVRAAIAAALASIDREAAGVERRLSEARLQAAGLFGNDGMGDSQRDPADERLLAEAERQLLGAARRLDQLATQRRDFEALLDQVSVGAVGRPAPLAATGAVAGHTA